MVFKEEGGNAYLTFGLDRGPKKDDDDDDDDKRGSAVATDSPWKLLHHQGYDEDELDDIMEMATNRKDQYLTTYDYPEGFQSFLSKFRHDLLARFRDKCICFMVKRGDDAMTQMSLQFDKLISIVNNNYWVLCFFNKD